jgi:hypothetical protein
MPLMLLQLFMVGVIRVHVCHWYCCSSLWGVSLGFMNVTDGTAALYGECYWVSCMYLMLLQLQMVLLCFMYVTAVHLLMVSLLCWPALSFQKGSCYYCPVLVLLIVLKLPMNPTIAGKCWPSQLAKCFYVCHWCSSLWRVFVWFMSVTAG